MWRHMMRAQVYDTALKEYQELEFRTTPSDLEATGPFPRVPLTVLVHDPEGHDQLASTESPSSGHPDLSLANWLASALTMTVPGSPWASQVRRSSRAP